MENERITVTQEGNTSAVAVAVAVVIATTAVAPGISIRLSSPPALTFLSLPT